MYRTQYILLAALLAIVSGCTKSSDDIGQFPHFGPREPHDSPFKSQKVILQGDHVEPEVNPNQPPELVFVLDNTCAEKQCQNDQNDKRISCFLFKSAERSKTLPIQLYGYKVSRALSATELGRWVNEDSCVLGVTNQTKYESNAFNDTYIGQQQAYLDTIQYDGSQVALAPANLSPVKVAVIDTGVGVHPDLGGATDVPGVFWREDMRSAYSKAACGTDTYTNLTPNNPHGTFVAGIISAKRNNSTGIVGIAPNAQIISLTVGSCAGRMTTTEIGNALFRANSLGAEVVNLSLGGATFDDPAVRLAIITALNSKVVIVASAGNSFQDLRTVFSYPASYSVLFKGLIGVGWGTVDGDIYKGNQVNVGSNFSPEHIKIIAPGSTIASTLYPDTVAGYTSIAPGYAKGNGSSFSAPIVSGAAAIAIGFLKKNNLYFDEQFVEYILIEKSVTNVDTLRDYIRNGALINFVKLGNVLEFIRNTGAIQRPVAISNTTVSTTQSNSIPPIISPYVTFTGSWNLDSTHFGARIGIFDATCGYSKPCLIQDYELPANSGSKTFTLTRNELLPMISALADPDFNLFVALAVYYEVKGPNTGKPLNNYGIDAIARINVRDLDMSTPDSPFLGQVTNIRSDMQYIYVQGWSCVVGSNKAVPVEVINTGGVPLALNYAYYYPWMFPHPFIADVLGHRGGPFQATDMRTIFSGQTSYKAGLEANPMLISKCLTFTAAQGFEFAIPIDLIKTGSLSGTSLSVRASHPYRLATKQILKDAFGASSFKVPDVNYQTTIPSSLALTRGGDRIGINGTFCSDSPSPIHVEVSFSNWDLRCRLKRVTNFPNFSDSCSLGTNGGPPLVYKPTLTDRDDFNSYYSDAMNPSVPLVYSSKLFLTAEERIKHTTLYPVRWPNSYVSSSGSQAYLDAVVLNGFKEVASGVPLAKIQIGDVLVSEHGVKTLSLVNQALDDRLGVSLIQNSLAPYWDWMDVGEPYTDSVVAYKFDTQRAIGDYLFRTYRVEKLMRETKKYETPIGDQSQVLTHITAPSGVKEGGACPFRFSISGEVLEMSKISPFTKAYIHAFLTTGESPLQNASIDTMNAALRGVPLDLRFFQDGVMIQHLLSNFESTFTKVGTFGRGGN